MAERGPSPGRTEPAQRFVRRAVVGGAAIAAVAVALQTAVHLVNTLVLEIRWTSLDVDYDDGPFTWMSTVAAFAAAFAALLVALTGFRAARLAAVAAVLAFFSLDDALLIHERLTLALVDDLGIDVALGRLLWPALYVPLLAFALAALVWTALEAGGDTRRAIGAGLALLALGVVAEMSSALLVDDEGHGSGRAYHLETALEEGAELGGWILVAAGLTALLGTRLAPPVAAPGRPRPAGRRPGRAFSRGSRR